MSIRDALTANEGLSEFKPEIFLQGSYKNGTNLRRDSDVDVVVRLPYQTQAQIGCPYGAAVAGKTPITRLPMSGGGHSGAWP